VGRERRLRNPQLHFIYSFDNFLQSKLIRNITLTAKLDGKKLHFKCGDGQLFIMEFTREKAELSIVRRLKPLFFIDVGAHFGLYSYVASAWAEKVIAIEPDPRSLKVLWRTIKYNRLSNVIVIPCACYCKDGETLTFILADNLSSSSLIPERPVTKLGKILVKSVTLDSLTSKLGIKNVDMVKIDVEGAECYVLDGGKRIIQEVRPFFLIEVSNDDCERVFTLFRANRYRVYGPFTVFDVCKNYVFVPEEKVATYDHDYMMA